MAGIEDPEVALAFNIECAETLYQSELDREVRLAEMFGLGTFNNALGGGVSSAGASEEYEVW